MALVKFNKVTTLPGTLDADTFYFVENGTFAESYITDSSGEARSVGNSAMINSLIQAALANFSAEGNALEIVPDIAARDSLTASTAGTAMILVVDASGDATVASGSALYAWDGGSSTLYKVAEYESMDVIVQWSSIQGGPASSPAQIDGAVTASHNHSNKADLDKIGSDADGLLFDGLPVSTRWSTNTW
ncbi:hypothetical protein NAV33_07275 [Pseudomonas stutzeri]|uniref:hypothetical protein n=1 Tax=Stutzerimonas stutzeri TaxID=316 RepID=UPI00210B7441|nr:hypothetical protein [Stutzerimonas stutzeri]MCQ4311695.1 hypothetical protein [Stutzerimonas stutzeri]